MKRLTTLIVCLAAASSLMLIILLNQGLLSDKPLSEQERLMQSPAYRLAQEYKKKHGEKEDDEKAAREGMLYLTEMRANHITGKINPADVLLARQQMYQKRAQKNKRGIPLNLQWEDQGPDNVGGRTRGFMIDRNNPQHILAGSVSGGLFVSYNEGLSWQPHPSNEVMGHLGILTIRQASNGDIYIGTGESFAPVLSGIPTDFGAPGFIGEGIYKSTDGGQTFFHLSSTTPSVSNSNTADWAYVNEIAIDPNNPQRVYASTNNGLKISNDGGTTWTNPSGIGNPANADSYEVTVGGNGVVYAEINFNYYRSTDGINFTNMTGTDGFPASGIGRIEFAVSPQDANYVYSVVSESGWSGGLKAILRSTDAGLTWSPLISAGSETFNPLGEQGTWNIALGIDPLNKDRIFVGGQLELWIYFHGGWNQVASAFGESPDNPYYVHADMHGIYFHPANNNIMFVISDGGIFKTYNATQQFPTFTMRNKGYTATQFYGITASDIGYTMGGSQDNGTQLIDLKGNTRRTADEVSGGDGGDCEISSINPNALFASTYNAQAYRSSNGGESFGDFYDNNLDRDNDGSIDQGSLFVMASFLWEKDNSTQTINGGDTLIIEDKRSVYFLGANGRLWFTTEALNFSSQSYWYDVDVSGTVTEVEVSHDGVIFCGTKNGNVYRIDGLYNKFKPDTIEAESTPTKTIIRYIPDFPEPSRPDPLRNYAGWDWPIYTSANADTNTYQGLKRTRISRNATWGSRYVTGIAVDPNDNNHVVVTLGSYGNTTYVYRTTNSNVLYPTFTGIQNDLPRMPVYDAIIDYYNSNNIILATELGIWASSDLGAGWNEENAGMASVPTLKLFQRKLYENGCQVIYAGTHGRGIFRTTTLTANGCKLIPGELPTGISEVKEVSQLQVYPNPVYEKAIVEFDVKDENSLVSLHVIDLLGRIHKNEKFANFSPGANQLEVGFNDIPAGVYMIVLQSGKTTESKRVFVTK